MGSTALFGSETLEVALEGEAGVVLLPSEVGAVDLVLLLLDAGVGEQAGLGGLHGLGVVLLGLLADDVVVLDLELPRELRDDGVELDDPLLVPLALEEVVGDLLGLVGAALGVEGDLLIGVDVVEPGEEAVPLALDRLETLLEVADLRLEGVDCGKIVNL